MESNSIKLISETNNTAIDVDADGGVPILQEEDEDDGIGLTDIPLANPLRRSKRQRAVSDQDETSVLSDDDETGSTIEISSDTEAPQPKRLRRRISSEDGDVNRDDDKKKLAMDVSYEGFAIYGRVLCLVVKKRETKKAGQPGYSGTTVASSTGGTGHGLEGQAMMENWITSTQIPAGEEIL